MKVMIRTGEPYTNGGYYLYVDSVCKAYYMTLFFAKLAAKRILRKGLPKEPPQGERIVWEGERNG